MSFLRRLAGDGPPNAMFYGIFHLTLLQPLTYNSACVKMAELFS